MQAREARLGVTLFNLEGVRREIEGDIAQLGERLPCKQEVAGSNPTISTTALSCEEVGKENSGELSLQSGKENNVPPSKLKSQSSEAFMI